MDFGYYPTAGSLDYAAPTYPSPFTYGANGKLTSGTSPIAGYQQAGGWAFQILPYMEENNVWSGGADATTTAASTSATAQSNLTLQMVHSIGAPIKAYYCPSRRGLAPFPQTLAASPYPNYVLPAAYLSPNPLPVGMIDYAGCNGGVAYGSNADAPNTGMIRTQSAGRNTVRPTDVKDGLAYTLLIGEKACSYRLMGNIPGEDDAGGYAAGYGGSLISRRNLNSIRFAYSDLLPLKDFDVNNLVGGGNPGVTGGAFGSAHPSTWNALMGDGSARSLSYNIDPNVFPTSVIPTTATRSPWTSSSREQSAYDLHQYEALQLEKTT